jgi:hypothetical protein
MSVTFETQAVEYVAFCRADRANVRSGSKADMCSAQAMSALCQKRTLASQQTASLFDHLVSTRKQRRRDFEPNRARGFEIDHELEFRRLLYR